MLYSYVTNILLDRLFTLHAASEDEAVLIASRRETNRYVNENFRSDLALQAREHSEIELRVEIATPSAEKAIQVADFVSWAIFREYEHGDDSYSRIIEKINQEPPLFYRNAKPHRLWNEEPSGTPAVLGIEPVTSAV